MTDDDWTIIAAAESLLHGRNPHHLGKEGELIILEVGLRRGSLAICPDRGLILPGAKATEALGRKEDDSL